MKHNSRHIHNKSKPQNLGWFENWKIKNTEKATQREREKARKIKAEIQAKEELLRARKRDINLQMSYKQDQERLAEYKKQEKELWKQTHPGIVKAEEAIGKGAKATGKTLLSGFKTVAGVFGTGFKEIYGPKPSQQQPQFQQQRMYPQRPVSPQQQYQQQRNPQLEHQMKVEALKQQQLSNLSRAFKKGGMSREQYLRHQNRILKQR